MKVEHTYATTGDVGVVRLVLDDVKDLDTWGVEGTA